MESAALGGRGDFGVWVPEGAAPGLPVVVLLHGAYGSHWHWAFRGGAHHIARRLIADGAIRPMALVMPSDGLRGATSGYFAQREADYEAWVMRDVLGACRALVPALGGDGPLFIAGYSMGGFGALRLGAKYARRVRGIAAFAPVPHLDELLPFLQPGSTAPVPADPEDVDVMTWMRRNRADLPPIRIDVGRADR